MKIQTIIAIFFMVIIVSNLFAQENVPRLSPKSFVGQTVGYTNVVITYGSPGVKGRSVWNDLVPYNKVWRTGANEATTIEFDNDVKIEGKIVPSGKYSLFTIPNKDSWIIILNKEDEQWGAYKYQEKEDLIRFKAVPKSNNYVERLRFVFEYISPYKTLVNFEWEKLNVSFEINTEILK